VIADGRQSFCPLDGPPGPSAPARLFYCSIICVEPGAGLLLEQRIGRACFVKPIAAIEVERPNTPAAAVGTVTSVVCTDAVIPRGTEPIAALSSVLLQSGPPRT